MAKEGKKLELYEILAAKRAKGKAPLGLDTKTAKQANTPEPPEITDRPGMIVDDAVSGDFQQVEAPETTREEPPPAPPPPRPEKRARDDGEAEEPKKTWFKGTQSPKPPPAPKPQPVVHEYVEPEPLPPPRPKSPREVVFSLDSALFFFVIVLVLVGTSFLIGYRRGQEEKPTGLAGLSLETMDGERLGIRYIVPLPRSSVKPPDHAFTLILRREPGSDELPERLEYELAEALTRGRKETGTEFPGFIFRTDGNDYILAVGLGKSSNDPELDRLYQIYNAMEGITLSRQPRPYLGCRVAPISELGTPVY